jgi:hypothetical protein
MHKLFDVRSTTGGRLVPDDLRRYGATVGGVAAGLVLVCIATYALGAAKASLSADMGLTASECQYSLIPLVPGQDTEATMTVSRRTPCQIRVRPVAGSIEDFSISDLPRHGTVAQRGWTGAIYQSDRGFRGDDSFAIAMRGKSANSSATSVVRVRVTVK